MYEIKKSPKQSGDNQKRQNIIRTMVIISCTLLVVLLILLLVILILRNQQQNNQNNKKYTSIFTSSLVSDTSSLDNKSFTVTSPTDDNTYLVSVVMNTTTSNASLGNYETHNYIYSIYGGSPNNVLTLTLNVKDSNNNNVSSKISDIEFTIELGDKDSHSSITLDKADETTKTATYSSSNEIKIYSISVDWYIAL